MTGASFALLTAGTTLLGLFAHATHFVLLPALAGLWLLLRAIDSRSTVTLLSSGALLGLGVLMKQHAIVFLALSVVLLAWSELRRSRNGPAREPSSGDGGRLSMLRRLGMELGALALGAAAPFVLVCLVFAWQGVLGKFWFWTFGYAREYVSQVPLSMAYPTLLAGVTRVTGTNSVLWGLAIPGAVALWMGSRDAMTKVFVTGLLVASFLGVCPGFYFREHYFILMIPAVALLSGIAADAAANLFGRSAPLTRWALPLGLFAVAAGSGLLQQKDILFTMDPGLVSRATYAGNPFPEAVEIARYVKDRTAPTDRIAVLGSEPEIYFYTARPSATGYIYAYPLMEPQKYASRMQSEMIRELEASHPKYIVNVHIPVSWLVRPDSDLRILRWLDSYSQRCYDVVGIVEILSGDRTNYVWDAQVESYQLATNRPILVLRRKSDAPCAVGASVP